MDGEFRQRSSNSMPMANLYTYTYLAAALATCAFGLRSGFANAQTIEEIIAAHETTISQLRTFDVSVDVRSLERAYGRKDKWARRGQVEVYEARTTTANTNNSGIVSKLMMRLDHAASRMQLLEIADETQVTTLLEQRGLRAFEAPFHRHLLEFQCHCYFLFRIGLTAADEWRTLRDLIAESEDCQLVDPSPERQGSCAQISLIHPGVEGKRKGQRLSLFLDREAGFLIRKVVIDRFPSQEKWVGEIARFRNCGSGVFFPEESTTFIELPDGSRQGAMSFVVTHASFNEAMDEVRVALTFPENALVAIRSEPFRPGPSIAFPAYRLMGKGGQVAREFASGGTELRDFLAAAREASGDSIPPVVELPPSSKQSDVDWPFHMSAWTILITALLVIGIIAGGLVVARRGRSTF